MCGVTCVSHLVMLMESCSHKETMFLEKSKSCGGPISIHKWEQRKNSVDLDVGRRPELKSDEFLL